MSEYRFNLLSLQQKDYLILGDSFCWGEPIVLILNYNIGKK